MKKYHTCLLDNDLYKFTMQLAICQLYPKLKARYQFINRDHREFPAGFDKKLRETIDSFKDYHVTQDEKKFLQETCYYLNPVYIDFLCGYRYDPSEVIIFQQDKDLNVFVEGPWYRTVLWEVPLMAIISELYFEMTGQTGVEYDIRRLNNAIKAKDLAEIDVHYSDFGTRRRFSYKNHNTVVEDLKTHGLGHMLGTSNVALAMQHNLIPMGTVAHEWYQAHAAMFGFIRANAEASEAWVNAYQGNLGIALPDTFTTDAFYKYGFDTKYAKLFDGVRQDSDDPFAFTDKTIKHYNNLRILPKLKTILYSDNLKGVDQIKKIHEYALNQEPNNRYTDRYGIGTWFTNDIGVKPLNIVIKLVGIDCGNGWVNTIKLSDSPTKHTGDKNTIELCLKTLGI